MTGRHSHNMIMNDCKTRMALNDDKTHVAYNRL